MTASTSIKAQEDVIQALEHADQPLTVSTLVAETILSETTVRTALKALEEAGKVQSSKIGQTRAYSIVQEPVPTPPPAQPPVPDLPRGKAKKETKPKADRPAPKPGARREAAAALDKRLHDWMIEHPEGLHGHDIAEAMGVRYNLLYIAIWRLHQAKIIEKFRDGTRAPVWRLTRSDSPAS